MWSYLMLILVHIYDHLPNEGLRIHNMAFLTKDPAYQTY